CNCVLPRVDICDCRRVVLPMWDRPYKMNRWTVPPIWGCPMKDVQEGNPTTHDMASPVLAGGGGR
ncbi:hypothetical protein LINPERHAP2_LOCUS39551, partial [Linum perenne]